jgi:WD40 repeat protein
MKNTLFALLMLLLLEFSSYSAEPASDARLNAYVDDIGRAAALVDGGNKPEARKILEKYAGAKGQDVRGFEWGHLWKASAPGAPAAGQEATEVIQMGHPWWLCADGRSVVWLRSAQGQMQFQLFDIPTASVISEVVLPRGQVKRWDFSRDGHWLGVVNPEQELELWDMRRGQRTARAPLKMEGGGGHLFSIDNRRAFAAGSGSRVQVWELPSLKPLSELTNAPNVTHMVGDALVAREKNGVRLNHFSDGRLIAHLEGHSGQIRGLDGSPDGRYLGTTGSDASVRVWEVSTGKLVHTLMTSESGNDIVQFSPDSRTLATAARNGSVVLWNLAAGRELMTLTGPVGPLSELLFAGNGRSLGAYDKNGEFTLWHGGSDGKEP